MKKIKLPWQDCLKFDTVEGENWKEIPDYPNYLVSDRGHIFTKNQGKIKRQVITRHGYCATTLVDKNKSKTFAVHRLVLSTFLPIIDSTERLCVNHKDRNKRNNKLDNLEWVTYSQNSQHAAPFHAPQHHPWSKRAHGIKYKGVTWTGQRYRAILWVRPGKQQLGCFDTQEEAALAYNKAAIERYGDKAVLNAVTEADIPYVVTWRRIFDKARQYGFDRYVMTTRDISDDELRMHLLSPSFLLAWAKFEWWYIHHDEAGYMDFSDYDAGFYERMMNQHAEAIGRELLRLSLDGKPYLDYFSQFLENTNG